MEGEKQDVGECVCVTESGGVWVEWEEQADVCDWYCRSQGRGVVVVVMVLGEREGGREGLTIILRHIK